jgi:hypothetical protein
MTDAIVAVLLPALATCVNPVPIIALIALLGTEHPKRNGAVYVITMLGVFTLVTVIDLALFAPSPDGSSASSTSSGGLTLFFGLIFLVVAIRQWRTPAPPPGEQPDWMKRLDTIGVLGSMVTGVALVNYALVSSATTAVIKTGANSSEQATAMVVYVILATITLTIPYLLYLLMPRQSMRLLVPFKGWLTLHSRVILIVVFGLMGTLFTVEGIVGLVR